MGAPKPCLGYRSRTEAVLALRGKGLSVEDIADRAGIPKKNVQTLITAHWSAKRRNDAIAKPPRTLLLTARQYNALLPNAMARGITVLQLTHRLIEALLDDGLTDAVLDDKPEGAR